jgi:hypothetical protein
MNCGRPGTRDGPGGCAWEWGSREAGSWKASPNHRGDGGAILSLPSRGAHALGTEARAGRVVGRAGTPDPRDPFPARVMAPGRGDARSHDRVKKARKPPPDPRFRGEKRPLPPDPTAVTIVPIPLSRQQTPGEISGPGENFGNFKCHLGHDLGRGIRGFPRGCDGDSANLKHSVSRGRERRGDGSMKGD